MDGPSPFQALTEALESILSTCRRRLRIWVWLLDRWCR